MRLRNDHQHLTYTEIYKVALLNKSEMEIKPT